jgi:thiamine pyrophosphate-dependent acetolactate synthase large subunit-like protein
VGSMSGAEAVVSSLKAHGVSTVFGIPGVHTLHIYDALRREPAIRHILARHEQGAGFMADGYARVTGKPGIACVITGPGVTNVATPVADAYADSIPLLVIATAGPRAWTGRPSGDLHELKDQFGVMRALAGWNRAVETLDEIPGAMRDAFRALKGGRCRGAYLQIPLDLLAQEDDMTIAPWVPPAVLGPNAAALAAAAKILREATRPVIVAGSGVTAANANHQLAQLAVLLGAPVLLGGKSRDVLPSDFPLALSVSGYGLPDALISLVSDADAVLVVGSKLGDQRTGQRRLRFAANLIHIEVDPAEIGRRYPARVAMECDAGAALASLIDALSDLPARVPPIAEIQRARASIEAQARKVFGPALDYLDAVRAATPPDGIIVADMTMLGYAAADYLPVHGPRTFIHASEICTIGCGLPLALGAKAGAPEKAVVALCGDGGFLLNTGELATAVQERLPVVVVVFNDSQYTAVKDEQRRAFGKRYIATDLVAPDYVALAKAFGADGVRAASPDQLRAAIDSALSTGRTTLIDTPLPRMF